VPSFVSNSRQRFLSLWLRRLSTDRIRRRWREQNETRRNDAPSPPLEKGRPDHEAIREGINPARRAAPRHPLPAGGEDTPLVVTGKRGNAERLVALDDAAEALGLHAGLALAEARAMHPGVTAVEEDADADASLLETVADWCHRYTPLVAVDGADAVLLDIGGCAHLFGGEDALRDDLVARLARFGFKARAAIADTIGAAWAAARFSNAANVPPGEQRDHLAPLPLAALRLPDETVAVLARVGLKRVADIIDLPRAPLAARFGAGLLQQLDRALGREREPLSPHLPAPPYFSEQSFVEPIAREEDVLATILKLSGRLRGMLERQGVGARAIELTLFRTDGVVRRIRAGTSRPVRDPQAIRALFAERLVALGDEWDPGFGFDLARLAILVAEPALPEQVGFSANGDDRAALGELTDRLTARLGRHRVTRLVAQDSHIPELAAAALPAQSQVAQKEDGWEAFRRYRAAAALSPRPLRLFARPEPIEAVAAVPDGPPLRFRWRRALHEVASAEGPERIEGLWWSEDEGPARDYFRVEDLAGRRFWLFRAGLYRDPATQPHWFMHGLFA
jgi:protein ImuB